MSSTACCWRSTASLRWSSPGAVSESTRTMSEMLGSLLAVGNVAEIFEWDSRVVKLYKLKAAKPAAFREAAIHATVEALGLPVPGVWGVQEIEGRWGLVFDRESLRSPSSSIGPTHAAAIPPQTSAGPIYC